MQVWISREMLRCPDLLVRLGDQLVCMLDVFMFIFMNSIVELVSGFHIDICGLMLSLFVHVDVGSHSSPGHRRRVVTAPPAAVPSGSSRRWQRDMDRLVPYMEQLATGMPDVGR